MQAYIDMQVTPNFIHRIKQWEIAFSGRKSARVLLNTKIAVLALTIHIVSY